MNPQAIEEVQEMQAAPSALVNDILGEDSGKSFLAALDEQAKNAYEGESEEDEKQANSRAFLLQYLDMITGKKGFITAGTVFNFQRILKNALAGNEEAFERLNKAGDQAWFKVFVAARNKMLHTKTDHFTNITKLRQVVIGSKSEELTKFFNQFMFVISKVSLASPENRHAIEGITRITLLMPMLTLIFASKPLPEDVQAILDKEDYAKNLHNTFEAMSELISAQK